MDAPSEVDLTTALFSIQELLMTAVVSELTPGAQTRVAERLRHMVDGAVQLNGLSEEVDEMMAAMVSAMLVTLGNTNERGERGRSDLSTFR